MALALLKNKQVMLKSLFSLFKFGKNKITEPELDRREISFDSSENPIVSIIIPFYNQENYTWNCLRKLKIGLTTEYPFEIYL